MNEFSALDILSTGLEVQRTRLNLTASNLANAQTTTTAEGGPYKRKDPVVATEPLSSRFNDMLKDELSREAQGVRVMQIVQDPNPPRMVSDPGHPDADANGFVAYPNVNTVEEMVNMILASRAYDAGVTAMGSVTSVARAALRIGSGGA